MPLEVTIALHDSQELALVHQLMTILEERRRNYGRSRVVVEEAAAQEVRDETQGVTAENPGKDVEPEAPVATIVAPGKAITLADMEKAAQAAIQTGGLAQVRGLVNQYTAGKIKEVDPKHWSELMEKLANVTPLVAAE